MTKDLPKIDLHCHLDGSVRPSTIIDIAKCENIELPSYEEKEIKKLLQAPSDSESLNEYLTKFELPNKVMQSKESLERIAFELLEDAAKENVKYIEIRFAPLLHTQKGLSIKEIIKSVICGIKKAESMYEIKGNIILICLKNMSMEDNLLVVKEGRRFLNKGVVGIDLAGPEEEGFSRKFKQLIDKARDYGYRITIHAGEAASGENVIDAITLLKAERIGHGVRIQGMKEACELVKYENVTLEMCPTSNIQTKAVEDFCKYPLYDFYKYGIKVTINTDNRTVSNVDLTHEINLIFCNFKLYKNDYKNIYLYAVGAAFTDRKTKKWLRSFI